MKFEEQINILERDIKRLKMEYELYFTGDSKRPPETLRREVHQILMKLTGSPGVNTQQKFRVNSLMSRFNAFSRMWDRIMIQIEQGTYKPDQFKADMRVGRISKENGSVEMAKDRVPRRFQIDENEKLEGKTKELYKTFIETRRVTGENVGVSYDSFKKSIDNSRESLNKKYGRNYEIKISIDNGKATVKGAQKK